MAYSVERGAANYDKKAVAELASMHDKIDGGIIKRLDEFRELWRTGSDEDIFAELVFCLLTPQSKAKSCWGAVECLADNDLILSGTALEIADSLDGVRFHNTKAQRIVEARGYFKMNDKPRIRLMIEEAGYPIEKREWLVKSVKGLGYKEASHFLRNIGMGEYLAILDRHILKNLAAARVIRHVPNTISRKRYLQIEDKMQTFSEEIGIPMDHLDIVMWYKEAGEIFK